MAADAPTPAELSGWWRRAGAYYVDGLIVNAAAVPVFFIAWGVGGDAATAGGIAYLVSIVLSLLVQGLVYAPLCMRRGGRRNGQTLGKQLLRIRVVRDDLQPMTYGTSAMREWTAKTLLFAVVASFVLFIPALVNYLWPLWEGRNRALHDMMVSTVVVRA